MSSTSNQSPYVEKDISSRHKTSQFHDDDISNAILRKRLPDIYRPESDLISGNRFEEREIEKRRFSWMMKFDPERRYQRRKRSWD